MKTIKYILFLCCIAIFASCYEDEGNYDYHNINEVNISGIPSTVEVDRLETLSLTPTLEGSVYGDDESQYEYQWELNKKVISTERNLNYEVTNSTGAYTLRLSVIDKNNKTKGFAVTNLVVNSSTSSDGILVISNQNGVGDMSYLRLD